MSIVEWTLKYSGKLTLIRQINNKCFKCLGVITCVTVPSTNVLSYYLTGSVIILID